MFRRQDLSVMPTPGRGQPFEIGGQFSTGVIRAALSKNCHHRINIMLAAFKAHASWGYFDFRMEDEGFENGFQSVPVDWGITSERKKAFFGKLKEITGK